MRTKIRLIIESVEENRGSVIVWSDVDIVFVRDFTSSVQRVFDQNREIDIAFQKEFRVGDAVSCGFTDEFDKKPLAQGRDAAWEVPRQTGA